MNSFLHNSNLVPGAGVGVLCSTEKDDLRTDLNEERACLGVD